MRIQWMVTNKQFHTSNSKDKLYSVYNQFIYLKNVFDRFEEMWTGYK